VLLALLLYTLHIALDTLTTLTPALWPLAPQIRVIVEMTGAVSSKGLLLATTIATETRPTDFTQKAYVEGPIVSEVGVVVVAVVTLVLIVAEHMAKKSRVRA
jgi:ABC-type xylose transport system permease subunit